MGGGQYDWALFPDHVVFLGAKAFIYPSWSDCILKEGALTDWPELIFIENVGVFTKPDFNLAKNAQLRCYFDVIIRVASDAILDPLDSAAVDNLLSWTAEKFRQHISK